MQTTWKEFKEYVEKRLPEIGMDENAEIEYMDFSYPDKYDNGKYNFGVFKTDFDNTFFVQ